MNKFIIFASILLISCKTEKTKIIDIENLINKSEILLISDTVNSYKCIVTFDTTVNQLFFYREKKKISLPKHKLFKINNTDLETNKLNSYNFENDCIRFIR